MTQQWSRLGIIHRPDTTKEWAAHGYCHVPTPLVMGDTVRVFYASLDANNRGSIGYCDLDGSDLTKVKYVSPDPVMRPGPLGAFDCDGVVPSCIIRDWRTGIDRWIMWYTGFQRTETVPYMLFSSVAFSKDGNAWEKWSSSVPMLDRVHNHAYSRSVPFELNSPEYHHMLWYWSCDYWEGNPLHYHNSIYCYDGMNLDSDQLCISPIYPDYAVGRPWVLKENGIYRMWFSSRGPGTYSVCYAESLDGLSWTRADDEVNSLMPDDGTNAEYPAIVDSGGKRWCVFNGAHNGRDGIELAVLEHE